MKLKKIKSTTEITIKKILKCKKKKRKKENRLDLELFFKICLKFREWASSIIQANYLKFMNVNSMFV